MSAAETPSGPHFWDTTGGKTVLGAATSIVSSSTIHRNQQASNHERQMRSSERIKHLNDGSLNPAQYVLSASRDNVPSRDIKKDLVSWGDKWRGTDFANPEAFVSIV